MDVVVYLAIAMLGVVFLFALAVLIVMCRRRYEYKRLLLAESLRFSKLRQENVEDIIQLSPHISQALSSNRWVYDVSGILEHCVAVLKLCHTLTDKLAKIPLNSISPQLNEVICQATARVVPRFDDLLKSMAAANVDVRLIEARVVALVTTCWSLVAPFYLMNPKYKEVFGKIIRDMEIHQRFLQVAVDQATENVKLAAAASTAQSGASVSLEHRKKINETVAVAAAAARSTPPSTTPSPPAPNASSSTSNKSASGPITLKPAADESKRSLLQDETAPADPQTS